MCGIVGHMGPTDSVAVVLEGLKRLEYRGYDSAGISFLQDNSIKTFKKTGKLENLVGVLKSEQISSNSAIGHTRWATHGKVTDYNSHPHSMKGLTMVHNGIIENADEIRDKLQAKGYEFKSETDSEVFVVLVTEYSKDLSLKDSILKAFTEIDGNSAFVFLDEETGDLYSIRQSAPLVCGIKLNEQQGMVSSDPYALVGVADQIYFPEDKVLCHLSSGNKDLLNFFELDGSESTRYKVKAQSRTLDETDKGDFEHFMLKEIYEQPSLIRSLTNFYFNGDGKEHLDKVVAYNPKRVHISACGTAFYAGLVVRDFLELNNRVPCSFELASEFRYRNPILEDGSVGLFVSQSGETADTLASQEECKRMGIPTLSLVNVEGSSLYRQCDDNLLIRAGMEVGVASTKAFTQMALVGRLLSFGMSKKYKDENARKEMTAKFALLADRMDSVLENVDQIKKIAEEVYNKKGYFFTGRNVYYPIALEGALKLKEIAYVHAEGYASGELKHGPIALIDEEMVNIAIVGPELKDKTISNIQEIKARKGIILSIGPKGDEGLRKISDYFIELDFNGLDELAPLYVNLVNQLLSYYMAKFKGTDIDKPRNLAKSVTVE